VRPRVLSYPAADVAGETRCVRYRALDFAVGTAPEAGPLNWSQQVMWALIEAMSPVTESLNVRLGLRLRADVTEDEVFDGLRDLVQTHEALRSLYVTLPQGPGQQVLDAGRIEVAIVECSDADADEQAAMSVMEDLAAVPFDIAEEWPTRVAVVCVGGQPRHLVFALCHLSVDALGVMAIKDHLRPLLRSERVDVSSPRVAYQMLREAEWERSPAGLRCAARAVSQHERTLSRMPQTMLPRHVEEIGPPRYRYLEFESSALAVAVSALAAGHNTTPATVLFAGVAAVSGFVSGLPEAFLQVTVANRTEPRLRGAVGMYIQEVPVCVDLADASIADVIARSGQAILPAARFGRYPPADMLAARRRVELRRGAAFDLSCWINYSPNVRLAPVADRPSPRALAQARSRTRWRWIDGPDSSTSSYFIFVTEGPDTLVLTVVLDTALLHPPEAVGWLRAVEQVLCASLDGDVAVSQLDRHAELTATSRSGDWCLTDAGWACLPDVVDLVRGVSGAPRAEVFAVPSAEGPCLTAFLDGGRLVPDIGELHTACVDALPGNRTVIAPQHYVVCAGAPRVSDLTGWQRLPVSAEGTGR